MFSVSRFVIALKVFHEITTSTSFILTPSSFPSGVSKIVATSTSTSNPYERETQIFATDDDEKEPSAKVDDGSNEETTASSSYDEPTDRFKYKVHALMGDYDPIEGTADDEDQDGNIMKALITFPTQHVFDVVGKISSDDETNQGYCDRVKAIVYGTTGDDAIECEIVPRGTKFVKVRCTAMVESTAMINSIYDELGQMESTVMKF